MTESTEDLEAAQAALTNARRDNREKDAALEAARRDRDATVEATRKERDAERKKAQVGSLEESKVYTDVLLCPHIHGSSPVRD